MKRENYVGRTDGSSYSCLLHVNTKLFVEWSFASGPFYFSAPVVFTLRRSQSSNPLQRHAYLLQSPHRNAPPNLVDAPGLDFSARTRLGYHFMGALFALENHHRDNWWYHNVNRSMLTVYNMQSFHHLRYDLPHIRHLIQAFRLYGTSAQAWTIKDTV